MKIFCHAILLIFSLTFVGCRAQRDVHKDVQRTHVDEIGVELRRVDSLWSSIAEKHSMKIEFYPVEDSAYALDSSKLAPSLGSLAPIIGAGRAGHIKSIEVSSETSTAATSLVQSDSTAVYKAETTEDEKVDKRTEARQDNGTVAIIAIVSAVAALIYFVIKAFLTK